MLGRPYSCTAEEAKRTHLIHLRPFSSRAYASGVASGLRGFRLRFCNVGCPRWQTSDSSTAVSVPTSPRPSLSSTRSTEFCTTRAPSAGRHWRSSTPHGRGNEGLAMQVRLRLLRKLRRDEYRMTLDLIDSERGPWDQGD